MKYTTRKQWTKPVLTVASASAAQVKISGTNYDGLTAVNIQGLS